LNVKLCEDYQIRPQWVIINPEKILYCHSSPSSLDVSESTEEIIEYILHTHFGENHKLFSATLWWWCKLQSPTHAHNTNHQVQSHGVEIKMVFSRVMRGIVTFCETVRNF